MALSQKELMSDGDAPVTSRVADSAEMLALFI